MGGGLRRVKNFLSRVEAAELSAGVALSCDLRRCTLPLLLLARTDTATGFLAGLLLGEGELVAGTLRKESPGCEYREGRGKR